MFCEKCGAKIDDNSAFCEKCGAKLESADTAVNPTATPQPNGVQPTPQPATVNISKKQLGIIAAVVVLLIVAVVVKKNWKYSVNLNDYINVEYSGYDSVGTAQFSFDRAKFAEKYANKIKANDSDDSTDSIGDDFEYYLSSCYFKYEDNLKNGDEISFTWSDVPSDKISEKYNCKLKYEDTTFTVSGLKEVNTIDPFEKITVDFSGVAPNGSAEYDNNNDSPVSDIYFSFDKSYNLSNGDEVTLKASDSSVNDYLAKQYGVVISPTEKTYTVEGLDSYVTKKDEITDDIIDEMKSQSSDIITSITSQWDSSRSKLVSSDYVGYYLVTPKNKDSYGDKNIIYLVYKFTEGYTTDEYNPAVNFSYYYVFKFTNMLVDDSGNCSIDTSSYSKLYGSFYYTFKSGEEHKDRKYNMRGYQTIDDFVRQYISANADKYTYETDIE